MLCIGYTKKGLPCRKKTKTDNYCCLHHETYKFEKPDDCPICMENIKDEKRPLECGHYVHKECLLKWNDICPTCRSPVKLTSQERKILNKNTNKIKGQPITIEINIDDIGFATEGINDIEDVNFDEWLFSIISIFNNN